jgi:hypothetical protein
MDDSFFDALDLVDAQIIASANETDVKNTTESIAVPEFVAATPTATRTGDRPTPTLDRFISNSSTSNNNQKDVDSRSGLTLRSRLLPASQVDALAKEYSFVALERVQSSLLPTSMYHGRDTFTIGVVAARSLPKMAKGKAGGKFVVWKLVDLNEASLRAPISLFLFADAYSTWWKESEGAIVCIVNPRAIAENDATSALKVEVADQLQKLGTAADFGTCTAVRRDGQPCTMFVNTAKSPVCHFHVGTVTKPLVRAEAKRKKIDMIERATISARLAATAASQPIALVPAGAAAERLRALREHQLAVHTQRATPVTLRPNELSSAVTPTVHMSGATDTAQTITLSGSMLLDKSRGAVHAVSRMVVPLRHAASLGVVAPPQPSSSAVLLPHSAKRALSQMSAPVPNIHPTTTNSTKRAALLREAAQATAATTRERAAAAATVSAASTTAVPTSKSVAEINSEQIAQLKQAQNKLRLVRSANAQAQLRGDRVSVGQLRTHNKSVPAASTALPSSVVRAAQLLAHRRPTQSVGLPTLTRTASVDDTQGDDNTNATAVVPSATADTKQLSDDEREKLRKATSLHDAAAGVADARTDAMLDSLTEREKALEAAESLREVTVTAFQCATCDRITVTSPTLCYNAGHSVAKLREVKKRFFRCARCNEPAISLGAPMPSSACIKCSGESFRSVSLAEFRGQQTVVQSILPTFRLNHDNADELMAGNARKRRWQDKDAEERAMAEDRQ